MTKEEQRIAIAEACGWKNVDAGFGRVRGVTTRHKGTLSEFDVCVDVPNYPFDLNAMHEAEKVLTREQEKEYDYQLEAACCPFEYGWHATASQRAEAFLRTIGKWKECK